MLGLALQLDVHCLISHRLALLDVCPNRLALRPDAQTFPPRDIPACLPAGRPDIYMRGSWNRWSHRECLVPAKMVPAQRGGIGFLKTTVQVGFGPSFVFYFIVFLGGYQQILALFDPLVCRGRACSVEVRVATHTMPRLVAVTIHCAVHVPFVSCAIDVPHSPLRSTNRVPSQVPEDAHVMDLVFSDSGAMVGGFYDNNGGGSCLYFRFFLAARRSTEVGAGHLQAARTDVGGLRNACVSSDAQRVLAACCAACCHAPSYTGPGACLYGVLHKCYM